MQRILVLRGGALGDCLVTLPALQALRAKWPRAWIDLIGNASAAALAVEQGLINRAESQHTGSWHLIYTPVLSPDLRARLVTYDLVINFWPDPQGEIARHFPIHPKQTFLTASAQPGLGPAASHFTRLLNQIGIWSETTLTRLRSPQPNADHLAVHAGSGSPMKNWPLERWQQLLDWLQKEHQFRIHIIRGEAEPCDALDDYGQVWRNFPLSELADRLARCHLFIGHDSGISHLAASCGHYGVLLFGPTDPSIWAPPTPRFQVVHQGGSMTDLTVEQVKTVVKKVLWAE